MVAFAVTTEKQDYDSDIGYTSDVVEIGREKSLFKALKVCAHAQLDWSLDSISEVIHDAVSINKATASQKITKKKTKSNSPQF